MQKERAAANPEAGREADYLKDEVAIRLSERLLVCQRPFLGGHAKLTILRMSSAISPESSI